MDSAIKYLKDKGQEPRVVILPNGCLTVPVLEAPDISSGWVQVKTDLEIDDMLEILDVVLEH